MPVSPPTYRPSFLPTRKERDDLYRQQRRDRAEQAFYRSKRWLAVRSVKLGRDPYCERCLGSGEYTPATHVHHRQELKAEPALALDFDNLMCVCQSCHSVIHAPQS